MATLVLTVVGSVLGGPVGGAIGAAIGSQLDQRLLGGKGVQGARLGSLAVQSSTYGSELPRLFGTMRVAGSVIWATDLIEDRHRTSTGKGRPKATTYSYSASFAVALSARPIVRVGRIWADGNLLRGAEGDWKSDLGAFRLYPGDEAQAIDPLIASAEGIAATPAYRGLAYAVFEALQLADFGNRIPSLSFEIVADDAPVTIATIAGVLSDGDVTGSGGPALVGYAAGGDSVRGAIEGLAAALPVAFASGADGLHLVDETADAVPITADDLGAHADAPRAPRLTIDRQASGTIAETVAIDYYDPARDFQLGAQRARRGGAGRRLGTIALPAACAAADARALAEMRLARDWAGRERASVTLPPRWLGCGAGSIVTLPGLDGRWRVTRRGFEAGAVTLAAQRLPGGNGVVPAASAGRATAQADLVQGPTHLALLDLPTLGDQPSDVPTLLLAAAGDGAGWRQATMIGSLDGGATWATIGETAAPAVMGVAASVLPAGDAMLVDARAALDVTLLHDGMALAGDDRLGWSASGNLLLVGDELVQFGVADALGPARWRLSRLLRGRRGTEWAMATHRPGERVVLIDADALATWALPASAPGATVEVAATGRGDLVPATGAVVFAGRALAPPSPAALGATSAADGIAIAWIRRSRAGWTWSDGGDAPLAEEAERYRATLTRGARSIAIETATPSLAVPAATLAALGTGPVGIAVVQIGTVAASRPAILTVPFGG